MSGFTASFAIGDPVGCPIAVASDVGEGPVDSVARTSTPGHTPVEEFSVREGDRRVADSAAGGALEVELTTVATSEAETVYRFERDFDTPCACEVVERNGGPVTSIRAVEGNLIVTVRATDLETITDVAGDLRDHFDGVKMRQLLTTGDDGPGTLAFVDCDRLTDRQRTVLETAHDMGYFEYPRTANATEIAEELDIARSTFIEHLSVAQAKLFDQLLE